MNIELMKALRANGTELANEAADEIESMNHLLERAITAGEKLANQYTALSLLVDTYIKSQKEELRKNAK